MLVDDIVGLCVGPISVDVFLEELMHYSEFLTPDDQPPSDVVFSPSTKIVTEMYKPFFDVINKHAICPGVRWHIIPHGQGDGLGSKYHTPDGETDEFSHENSPEGNNNDASQLYDWRSHALVVKFVGSEDVDPFRLFETAEKERPNDKAGSESWNTLEQLVGYTNELFTRQHRSHLFQLVVVGDTARFIRWDSAGAIVSAPFNYIYDSKPLVRFLWLYDRMSPAHRGWDMSVKAPSENEQQTFRAAIRDWIDHHSGDKAVEQRFPGAELTLDERFSTYKLTVEPVRGMGIRQELVIQRPFYQSYSNHVIGPVTRAYLAYSLTESQVVFYKSGWRVEADGLGDTSGYVAEVYKLLTENVGSTSAVLCAGDVTYQGTPTRTVSDRWTNKTDEARYGTCTNPRSYVLYRIVQRVAYPVQWLSSSRQFTSVLHDCFIAIGDASEAGILHRDVSIENVTTEFTNDDEDSGLVRGIPNEWDNFGYVKKRSGTHSVRRCGTWEFMSIFMLGDPERQPSIIDDLQSLYWVLLYESIRRFCNNENFDWDVFSERRKYCMFNGTQEYVGGGGKRRCITDGLLRSLATMQPTALRETIVKLNSMWKRYYDPDKELLRRATWGRWALDSDQLKTAPSICELQIQRNEAKQELSIPQLWLEVFDASLKLDSDAWLDDAVPALAAKPALHTTCSESTTSGQDL